VTTLRLVLGSSLAQILKKQNVSWILTKTIHSVVQPYDFLSLVPVIEGAGGSITDWEGNKLHWPVTSESRPTSIIPSLLLISTNCASELLIFCFPHTRGIQHYEKHQCYVHRGAKTGIGISCFWLVLPPFPFNQRGWTVGLVHTVCTFRVDLSGTEGVVGKRFWYCRSDSPSSSFSGFNVVAAGDARVHGQALEALRWH
jgi:hypothetical protein